MAKAIAVVARGVRVPASAVHTRATTDNSDAPECVFSVPGRRLRMWVSVNSEPQPYAVLERAATEESQMFTVNSRTTAAPQALHHLGLDAYWFPQEEHAMTTDGVHLITATIVAWPHVPKRRWKALAASAARPYLGRNQPKLARGPSP
jgi:hypothetical protein